MQATELFETLTGFAEDQTIEHGGFRRSSKRIKLGLEALFYPSIDGVLDAPELIRLREMSVGGISVVRRKTSKPPTSFVLRIQKPGVGLYWLHCTTRRHGPTHNHAVLVGASIDSILVSEESLKPGTEVASMVWDLVA